MLETKFVHGKNHVIVERNRQEEENNTSLPNPNYLDTNKALCGILKDGQSIEEFTELYLSRQK